MKKTRVLFKLNVERKNISRIKSMSFNKLYRATRVEKNFMLFYSPEIIMHI
jgi:hypothetical protein